MKNYLAISLTAILTFISTTGAKAQSVDWNAAIVRVEKSAQEYSDYAFNILGSKWVGPANDSIRFDTHRCAILGRMLGQAEAIQHIETFEYPPLDGSVDAFDLLVFSLTLENWVAAARASLEMGESERVNVWNLECVGEEGIPTDLFLESSQPNATFEVRDNTLVVYGDIDSNFYARFREQLDATPEVEEIALGSGGGSVRDALLAGYEIRRRGLSTVLHGNCFSACPLVFMGGVERILWASPHRLGFHQFYTGAGIPIPFDDQIYVLTTRYMIDMGVDPEIVLPWILSAPPGEMFEPDVRSLCSPGVSTFVQRICSK
jgi:hypothetical protein